MGENWDVIKGLVEKTISDNKIKVTEPQMKAIRALVNYDIGVGAAESFVNDMGLAKGSAELFGKIMDIIVNGTGSEEAVAEETSFSLWDAMAKVLYATQPDDSEYIITKRQ